MNSIIKKVKSWLKKYTSLKSNEKVDEFMKDLIKNHEFEMREDGLYLSIFKINKKGFLVYPEVCDKLKNSLGKPLTMVKMYLKYKKSKI
jgi:hypothetical protein